MSGNIIKKVIDVTTDYDASEDWIFGIMDATPSTVDITTTLNTTYFGSQPSGATKTFINSGTAHNLILDPNGATL